MKKVILGTAAVLALFVLAACGDTANGGQKGTKQESASTTKADGAAKPAGAAAKAPKVFSAKQAEGTKATCPVLGHEFTIAQDTEFSEYKGQFVYYCCPGCKGQFDADPEKYLKK